MVGGLRPGGELLNPVNNDWRVSWEVETSNTTETSSTAVEHIRRVLHDFSFAAALVQNSSCCCLLLCSRNAQLNTRILLQVLRILSSSCFLLLTCRIGKVQHCCPPENVLLKQLPAASQFASRGNCLANTRRLLISEQNDAMSPLPMQRFAPRYLEDRLDRLCPDDSA